MASIELIKEISAAGIGCAIADSFFNPLEIVKVRLQVEGGTGSIISLRRVYEEILHIVRYEGFLQLWSPGLLPTCLRGLLYAGFRIGMYPTVRDVIHGRLSNPAAEGSSSNSRDSLFTTKLLAGGLCGAVGSFIFSPLDLVRIKFQRNPTVYGSTFSAFRSIYGEGGARGLWCGASATVLRATMLSGCQLSIYDQIKSLASSARAGGDSTSRYDSWLQEGPVLHASASLMSGVIAQGVIMPVDVIKTKMMVAVAGATGSGGGAASMRVAATQILREGGVGCFYRGFVPALMRQGPCILIQVPTRGMCQ